MAPIPPQDQPNDRPDGEPHSGRKSENRHSGNPRNLPALRRTIVRPAGHAPDPVDAAFVVNRLTTLTHELSTLLDGSLRVVGLARRSLSPADDRLASRRDGAPVCPEQLARQLDTLDAAIRQMADLVRSTMLGMAEGGSAGLRLNTLGSSSSLADAIRHAVDVMTPLAEEHRVQLEARVSDDLGDIAAGPIYAVIVNGVRNAIESIQRMGDEYVGGHVVVRCWTEAGRTGRCVMITIEDDGAGLPRPSAPRAPRRKNTPVRPASAPAPSETPFRLGFTTKPGGSGIGLSLSRDVVEQLGGTIQLIPRPKDPHSGRCGATLTVCYPVPPTSPTTGNKRNG